MMDRLKRMFPFLLQFVAGIAIPLSMAPYDWHVLAYVALFAFLFGLEKQTLKRAFVLGLFFGLGLFGWGASWIFVSIYHYGNTNAPIATLITSLFVAILALYPAFTALFLNWLAPKMRLSRSLLVFPALWVGMEWLRGTLFTGFPWLFVGYSQFNIQLSQFAPIGGIWAVSFATAFMGGILYALFCYYKNPNRTLLQGLPIFLSIVFLWGSAFWLKQNSDILTLEPGITVALVQGNIEQSMKWDSEKANQIVQTYHALGQTNYDADIIIWPETAIPWPLSMAQNFLTTLDQETRAHGVGLITGIPEEAGNDQYYNAIIALGEAQGHYRKQRLVPFGEYVPMEKWLRGLIGFFDLPMSSFISGASHQAPITSHGLSIAPTLCYEIAYPDLVRENAKNADVLLTISNDGWFGYSIGPHQHLQIAQFRALETGKFLIRSTNTGWTALINPKGFIAEEIPRFETKILRGTIRASATNTLWMTYGASPLFGILAGLFFIGCVHQLWARKKGRS